MVFNFHNEQQHVRPQLEALIERINVLRMGWHRKPDLELTLNVYTLLKYLVHDVPTPTDTDWSCVRDPVNTGRVGWQAYPRVHTMITRF